MSEPCRLGSGSARGRLVFRGAKASRTPSKTKTSRESAAASTEKPVMPSRGAWRLALPSIEPCHPRGTSVRAEVPEGHPASRPAGRRPGLTIHRLEGGVYRESPESRAFSGWWAAEIHTAVNEALTPAATGQVARARRPRARRPGRRPSRTAPRGSARVARKRAPCSARKDTPRGEGKGATKDESRSVAGSWRRSLAGFSPPEGLPGPAPGSTRRAGLAGRRRRRNRRHPPSERGRGGFPHAARMSGGGVSGERGRRIVASAIRLRRDAPPVPGGPTILPEGRGAAPRLGVRGADGALMGRPAAGGRTAWARSRRRPWMGGGRRPEMERPAPVPERRPCLVAGGGFEPPTFGL